MVCPEDCLLLCVGTCGNFKCWDTGDLSGDEMEESLITVGVRLGFSSDAGCSEGGNMCKPASSPLGCSKCLFISLPDYSPCAVKRKKSDHCETYRPLELIEMYMLELETQPAAPSAVPSNSFKADVCESGLYLICWPGLA